MISLRDYQESAVARLRQSVMQHKRVVLVAPTGSGKTRMALRVIQGAIQNGKTVWFVVHRRELCNQTSRAFWEQKLEHGMIMSGRARSTMPAQVGTILTAANRVTSMKRKPDIIIVDEGHRGVSPAYLKLYAACPDAIIILLTATPQRTDGRGLGEICNDIVEVEPMRWLMDNGYLCDYKLIAPPSSLDMSGVRTKMGDYDTAETEKAIDRPSITGDAIKVYRQYVDGKRCMVFCVTIKHSQHVCDQYNASGIPAEHIDGTHTDAEREAALSRFRSGQTLVLTTVQLAIEGLDIPAVEAVQLLRPTKSIIVYLQIIGRGLRPEPGKKHLYILDQVRNWEYHGLPDDDREWSLDSQKKRQRKADDEEDVKVKQCASCWTVFRPGPTVCPNCGAPVSAPARQIEQVDGEVVEIDVDAVREQHKSKREQQAARSLEDLVKLAVRRGGKNPSFWAAKLFASRLGKQQPSKMLIKESDKILKGMKNEGKQHSETGNAGAF